MPSFNSSRRTLKKSKSRRVRSANSTPRSRNYSRQLSIRNPARSNLRYIRANHPRTPSRRYARSIIL